MDIGDPDRDEDNEGDVEAIMKGSARTVSVSPITLDRVTKMS